jgi:hypothetical protein
VKPFGTWQGAIGENLTYGNESARERVLTWLIDDGFASRGHRKRLLSSEYKVAGLACGPHPEFGNDVLPYPRRGLYRSATGQVDNQHANEHRQAN